MRVSSALVLLASTVVIMGSGTCVGNSLQCSVPGVADKHFGENLLQSQVSKRTTAHVEVSQERDERKFSCEDELTFTVIQQLTAKDKEELVQDCKDMRRQADEPTAGSFACCLCGRLAKAHCESAKAADCEENFCSASGENLLQVLGKQRSTDVDATAQVEVGQKHGKKDTCNGKLTFTVVQELTAVDKEELVQDCKDMREQEGPQTHSFACCLCGRVAEASCEANATDCLQNFCLP